MYSFQHEARQQAEKGSGGRDPTPPRASHQKCSHEPPRLAPWHALAPAGDRQTAPTAPST